MGVTKKILTHLGQNYIYKKIRNLKIHCIRIMKNKKLLKNQI